MPSRGDEFRDAAIRDARLIDELTEAFAQELEQVLILITARIRRLLRQLETDTTGRIAATETNLALALRMRQDLTRALEDGGYPELVTRAADAPLDRLARQLLDPRTRTGQAVQLAAFDLDALVAMKQLRLAELLQVGDDVAVQLWRITLDGVVGARPVLDLVDDIADVLDISARHARTVYDTAVATFSRQVEQLGTTGAPDEAFLYVGPDDEKTRPFCEAHVDRVYSRAAIDTMDNGQLPNVLLTAGGYNCRHLWKRVSRLDQELLDLVDTGERYQDRKA
jgi:hypothetical protein